MPIQNAREATSLDATEARDAWSDTLNRAAYGKERLVLHRRGKPVAALIPIEDLKLLERLIQETAEPVEMNAIERKQLAYSTQRLLDRIRARMPEAMTDEELAQDAKEAIAEARAERDTRGL